MRPGYAQIWRIIAFLEDVVKKADHLQKVVKSYSSRIFYEKMHNALVFVLFPNLQYYTIIRHNIMDL